VTAVGSLAGGYLCDRFNRRRMYILSGLLTAACGLVMGAHVLDRANYLWGFSAYLLISGLCYAAFSAVVLEAIGTAGEAASAQYTLFSSAGNTAIAYVAWLDGVMFASRFGKKAPLFADATLNLIGVALLGVMLFVIRARKPAAVLSSQHGDSGVGR